MTGRLLVAMASIGALLTSSRAGRTDQTRFSIGAGVMSAGSVSGGFVLAPTLTYSFRLSDDWEVAMTARVLVTGIAYKNPGVVVHVTPTIGFTWDSGYVTAGPSLDAIDTILCGANAFCNRAVGVAPGASVGAAYFTGAVNDRLGIYIDAHISVLPVGAIYDGVLVTITAGPVLRLGKLSR